VVTWEAKVETATFDMFSWLGYKDLKEYTEVKTPTHPYHHSTPPTER
jgi:hypothetical protein